MSDLLDFSTYTTFKRTHEGGKVIEASVLCYAYVNMSFLNSDSNKYRNFFLKRNWPTNFINVGTGLYLARGSSVQANGQALVFFLNKVKETAFLEGRKQKVTFYEVCVPDALKKVWWTWARVFLYLGERCTFLPSTYHFEVRKIQGSTIKFLQMEHLETYLSISEFLKLWEVF